MDDVDLRSASHERAVEVIRAAGNPVRFKVQSLVQWVSSKLLELIFYSCLLPLRRRSVYNLSVP